MMFESIIPIAGMMCRDFSTNVTDGVPSFRRANWLPSLVSSDS